MERDIEERLPEFQELVINLQCVLWPFPPVYQLTLLCARNSETPALWQAPNLRRRLLEDFAKYDAIAKRIRTLRCVPGSSQDRVQVAILNRANLFLQRNMFPLQVRPLNLDLWVETTHRIIILRSLTSAIPTRNSISLSELLSYIHLKLGTDNGREIAQW